MNISDFYRETLGANLRNERWSWGAYDPVTSRLFLRVWEDHVQRVEGAERVLVDKKWPESSSHGANERRRHLDLMESGAEAYGIVCTAADTSTRARRIATFDDAHLLRLGSLSVEGADTYARIVGRAPVADLRRPPTGESTLTADLLALARRKGEPTTKEALVSARVGQGAFRKAVLATWDDRCAVTGARTLDAIRASHIKPWRASTDKECLDPQNGLPFVASLDALFDAGLISFDQAGGMLISSLLDDEERSLFGLHGLALRRPPTLEMAAYLAYHRDSVFRK